MENVLIAVGGLVCIGAAYYDWDWFFNNYRLRFLRRCLGRAGTRLFYALMGGFFMVFAVVGHIMS